jgi:hypothetical protein
MIEFPAEYLLKSSRSTATRMQLEKLNLSANLNKQLKKVLSEWIDARATEIFITWMIENGERLILLAAEPETERKYDEPRPVIAPPQRYEFWRSQQRHERRKAG